MNYRSLILYRREMICCVEFTSGFVFSVMTFDPRQRAAVHVQVKHQTAILWMRARKNSSLFWCRGDVWESFLDIYAFIFRPLKNRSALIYTKTNKNNRKTKGFSGELPAAELQTFHFKYRFKVLRRTHTVSKQFHPN